MAGSTSMATYGPTLVKELPIKCMTVTNKSEFEMLLQLTQFGLTFGDNTDIFPNTSDIGLAALDLLKKVEMAMHLGKSWCCQIKPSILLFFFFPAQEDGKET